MDVSIQAVGRKQNMPMTKWATGWVLLIAARLVLGAGASSVSIADSYWYDWGIYGVYPQRSYESFSGSSPWPNILKSDSRCAAGYTFIEPRGLAVGTPGPIMLDQNGNLVWMQTEWGQAMDVKVQSYKGDDYITFWHGSDNGTFGQGYYLMVGKQSRCLSEHVADTTLLGLVEFILRCC